MCFDVTFHPIRPSDLQYFLFDVLDDPALVDTRAHELAETQDDFARLRATYRQATAWAAALASGTESDFNATLGYVAAAISGYLYPFWHAKNSVVSFLASGEFPGLRDDRGSVLRRHSANIRALITPIPDIAAGSCGAIVDPDAGLITGNYQGSGYIGEEDLPRLIDSVEPFCLVDKWFDVPGINALNRAVDFAQANGCGLIEATDLVDPERSEVYTNARNLRALFLDNVKNAGPSR